MCCIPWTQITIVTSFLNPCIPTLRTRIPAPIFLLLSSSQVLTRYKILVCMVKRANS